MADQDIFGLTQTTVGAQFARGDTFILQKGEGGQVIGLAQNVSVAYSRPLQPVYSLGTSDVAMTTGRPQGQLNIARVIGKLTDGGENLSLVDLLGDEFFKITGDAIGGVLKVLPLSGNGLVNNDNAANNFGYTMSGCFVVGEQFGGSAQDVVIIESVQIQFIAMTKGLGNA